MSSLFHDILRTISGAMEGPVVVLLILMIAFAIFSIGWLIAEYFAEHRLMKENLPALTEKIRSETADRRRVLKASQLNKRQRAALLEMLNHPDFSSSLRESLGVNLLEREQAHYDRIVKITELVSKLSPMLGLLGTLIPLGPGIIALGQGDTYTLSTSLLTAFDTTIAGLCVAAVCMVITGIRKRWYNQYMADLETLMDFICEGEATK